MPVRAPFRRCQASGLGGANRILHDNVVIHVSADGSIKANTTTDTSATANV